MPIMSFRVEDQFRNEIEFRAEQAGINVSELIKRALEVFLSNAPEKNEPEKPFKLSKLERLFLVNQYRILEKIDPENAQDSREKILALQDGFELQYSWTLSNFSDGLTNEECKFVLDTLSMYRLLRFSFDALKLDDSDLATEIEFEGFDGNEEGPYYNYVNYFIYDLDRYEELKAVNFKKSFNSHTTMIDTYKLMLLVYEKLMKSNQLVHKDLLTEEQIRSIVYAPPWKSKKKELSAK